MSFAQGALIDAYARLRLACRALSKDSGQVITPDDLSLDDLSPIVAAELRREATEDVWDLLTPTITPRVTGARAAP